MPRSPQWMNLYQIWFRVSSRGRNQLCGFLLQSAHAFRFSEWSNSPISHWLGRSPLTQCWRYRAACDHWWLTPWNIFRTAPASVPLPCFRGKSPKFDTIRYDTVCLTCSTVLTLCLPCAALSWGQPTWQGLGFSGLVHEETHPCASNFIQSIFETVQAGSINSILVQTVQSVNDSIWEIFFKNILVKSCFTNFLTTAT